MNFSPEWLEKLGDPRAAAARAESLQNLADSYAHFCRGYEEDPQNIILGGRMAATHAAGQEVTVAPIPFYSLCQHHLLPFFGMVTITYRPREYILSLGRFPRLVEALSARLNLQEHLTAAIADALQQYLQPQTCAVTVEARHLCLEMRGTQTVGAQFITRAER